MNGSRNFIVDSNILIYAFDNSQKSKHGNAMQLIQRNFLNPHFFLSIQNLVEFYSAVTLRIALPIELKLAAEYVLDFSKAATILMYSPSTISRASTLQQHYSIHFWDALIVATMLENDIYSIYTENIKDFKKVPGIQVINPFEGK